MRAERVVTFCNFLFPVIHAPVRIKSITGFPRLAYCIQYTCPAKNQQTRPRKKMLFTLLTNKNNGAILFTTANGNASQNRQQKKTKKFEESS